MDEIGIFGGEKAHIPKERGDFAFACCGENVQFLDAKKVTFQRKGVIFPIACCGGKVQISKKMLDFACLLACFCC